MKKWLTILLPLCILLGTTACGSGDTAVRGEEQSVNMESVPTEESDTEKSENLSVKQNGSSILIAYFTWADNTIVEDEEAAIQSALSHYDSIGDSENYEGVDATTSASVLPPGNTAQMAEWIQRRVGGDLFSIVAAEPYSSDYDECLDRAADEKAENARPELVNHIDNMDDYLSLIHI